MSLLTNQDCVEFVEIVGRGFPEWLAYARHVSMRRKGGLIQINGLVDNERGIVRMPPNRRALKLACDSIRARDHV